MLGRLGQGPLVPTSTGPSAELRIAFSAEQLDDIGRKLADDKAKAPAHPHPAAPASGPGAEVAGPAAGMVDRARDKLGDRPADADAQP
jgi:hypothetical protein